MNCKDCFHYRVCEYHCSEEVKGWDNTYDINDYCNHFKDKNKIIELPCKVGDTVYLIFCQKIYECRVKNMFTVGDNFEMILDLQYKEKDGISTFITKNYTQAKGKTLFLSKADAENKLKGGKI